MATTRRTFLCLGLTGIAVGGLLVVPPVRRLFHTLVRRIRGAHTVADRLSEFTAARERIRGKFADANLSYPPEKASLLAIKRAKVLEAHASSQGNSSRKVCEYPILAASGKLGPKLRSGDRQVPEGVYGIESLNPDSSFEVALRVGYPNDFDRESAAMDGRSDLGGDIMIHGGSASIGCLAMGDSAAEELFVLAAETGLSRITIIITPVDLRAEPLPAELAGGWRDKLYAQIREQLQGLS